MTSQDITYKDWTGRWGSLGENLLHSEWTRCDMTLDDFKGIEFLLEKVKKPNMQMMEVGSASGSSASMLAIYALRNKGKAYTCDPYRCFEDGKDIIYLELHDDFVTNIKTLGLTSYITSYVGASYDVVNNEIKGKTFDFIFIDGNHTYPDTKKDIELYYPLLNDGGIICGHDCEMIIEPDGVCKIGDIKLWDGVNINTLHYHPDHKLSVSNGEFNIKNIVDWDNKDITGLRLAPGESKKAYGIHTGVIMAVAEKFNKQAGKLGDRIWYVAK